MIITEKSLWGNAIVVSQEPVLAKKISKKIKNPIEPKVIKKASSKDISIEQRLSTIKENVYRILGPYKNNTQVIKTKEQLDIFFEKVYANGIIAIDTETNNSLDPITCKLMGLCFYTPGEKNTYIPINHVNRLTNIKLDWQLTEEDIKEKLLTLEPRNIKIIMHNGKFDYQVIKCTCYGVELQIYWDTIVGARILDENEPAGLKIQYISKIDPSIEKYDIESLFEGLPYEIVDPDVFALYAATDAYMTYRLYEYQLKEFSKPENTKMFKLFLDIEMPMVQITAEMELTGICVDTEYATRLLAKYRVLQEDVDKRVSEELHKYDCVISEWRKTPDANEHPMKLNKKTGLLVQTKSKSEQLKNPVEVTSPTQLAIFLYDVLKMECVDKKKPRGTGEEILDKIKLPICKVILEKRALEKLISTYIEAIPNQINQKTGRLHAKFNQLGAGTGRLSSSDPNLQNIPSHNKEIRLMFVPSTIETDMEINSDTIEFDINDEVNTTEGWVIASKLTTNNHILYEDNTVANISNVDIYDLKVKIVVYEVERGD
jgi:DNA polymerase-1